eukprot:SAG31_NODE_35659_length_321_cov_0.689189_1_plen_46_part_01
MCAARRDAAVMAGCSRAAPRGRACPRPPWGKMSERTAMLPEERCAE